MVSAEPISSTTANDTSATTREALEAEAARPARVPSALRQVGPGLEARGSQRRRQAEDHAREQAEDERERQNGRVQPDVREPGTRLSSGPRLTYASHTPSAPATAATTRLSVSSWRTSRARPEPTAARIAISRLRAPALARSRLATFAQPMSSMQPAAPSRIRSAGRLSRVRFSAAVMHETQRR